jgi:hypothetical protein
VVEAPHFSRIGAGFARGKGRTAPMASGWSESRRTGFAPAERQRLSTARDRPRLIPGFSRGLFLVILWVYHFLKIMYKGIYGNFLAVVGRHWIFFS